MHSIIIEISPTRIRKNEIESPLLSDDPVFNMEADWGGDNLPFEQHVKKIRNAIRGFATLNVRRRTITFKDEETVRKRVREILDTSFSELDFNLGSGIFSSYNFRKAFNFLGMGFVLFYGSFVQYPFQVIEDYLNGYLPKKVFIGSITDYHN